MSITLADLSGYTDRDLDADLTRWFPDAEAVEIPAETRPVTAFLARLAPVDAAALAAFDRRVRSGRLPQFLDIFDWSYGFDFAGNDCTILDSDYSTELSDDDVYTIGADGGGNLYAVLTSGQVAVWFHEEEVLEEGTRFDNLDVFLWSYVRYRAVRAGKLALADVEADFRALGQDGALEPELGLLHLMK
ncbi:hypothetical protein [Nocardia huaxiensis]|uniref:SMI1/KNR4 family protein n=1 Tax=Nocardia huaxiensis TaxID=2755382 RepID=A0A7D6V7F2_9NOCA|nr:hypothetical protein [Nocardia huaxiensis]QLY27993.1 hypothetical protein H0264_21520 [Nocardia huaxiensis]UFS98602.1 hypothetical protein LPY97_12235 [Nocardia huaxiensis]